MFKKQTMFITLALCACALCVPAVAGAQQPDPLDHAALAEQAAQNPNDESLQQALKNAGADDNSDSSSSNADAASSANSASSINMTADALHAQEVSAWSLTSQGYIAEDLATIIPGALVKGVDVSTHQGEIDWDAVKADGVSFAIIRIGYGGDYSDQDDARFEENVSACERLGIDYGIYLYSYAIDASSGRSEAEHVLRVLGDHKPSYPIYLDLEEECGTVEGVEKYLTSDDLAEIATAFCTTIENAGYTAGIYASLSWWDNYLTDSCFSQWERWVAQWNNYCSYSGEFKVWQAASDASVDGISGNVDVDFDYSPYRAAGYKTADLNMNGTVNVVDAQIAYDIICNNEATKNELFALGDVWWTDKTLRYFVDVNNDSQATASDAWAIQYKALRGEW